MSCGPVYALKLLPYFFVFLTDLYTDVATAKPLLDILDHGDVPLFHEIINRFDYEKNPRIKDMVQEAFRGYINTIVSDLVIPKLMAVKWKGNERLNVMERYPNLGTRLAEHVTNFFIGGKRIQSKKDSLMGYISDTLLTILLLTAKFAPAQSVKQHEERESLKAKEELANRMHALEELKTNEYYDTVIDRESERLLARLLEAVESKHASQQESELLLQWMTSAANLITSQVCHHCACMHPFDERIWGTLGCVPVHDILTRCGMDVSY